MDQTRLPIAATKALHSEAVMADDTGTMHRMRDAVGCSIDVRDEIKLHAGWLNSAFRWMLHAESNLIKSGLHLPLGGSRLIVARAVRN